MEIIKLMGLPNDQACSWSSSFNELSDPDKLFIAKKRSYKIITLIVYVLGFYILPFSWQKSCHYICINFLLVFYLVNPIHCKLTINLQNSEGEIYHEILSAHLENDLIEIQVFQTSGHIFNILIDHKKNFMFFNLLTSSEQELDYDSLHDLCFAVPLENDEFISTDAVSRLIQKNRGTIREAEYDKLDRIHLMDILLNTSMSSLVSPHLLENCHNSAYTFLQKASLNTFNVPEVNASFILKNLTLFTQNQSHWNICKDPSFFLKNISPNQYSTSLVEPCTCKVKLCIPWYPCALKYCKDPADGITTIRCGIKTCKRCHIFFFPSNLKECTFYW